MKKLIYLLTLSILILFCSISYFTIHKKSEAPEITLYKSFESCGANIINSEIYFYGSINSKYENLNDIKLLSDNISKDLGIDNDGTYSKTIDENDNIQKVEINAENKENKQISIKAQIMKNGKKDISRSISVTVTDNQTMKSQEDLRGKVLMSLKKYRINPKINTCVTGNFKGKLTDEQMNDVCKNIFNASSAVKVEGMRDDNLISVCAYSPLIDDYIKVNRKDVNINLAVRYNSYEDKTYIWLATPVISTEY